jgi:hypothetical protein
MTSLRASVSSDLRAMGVVSVFLHLLQSSHTLPDRDFWEDYGRQNSPKPLILLVPGERIELPTNGLQNRCSTAELTRLQ